MFKSYSPSSCNKLSLSSWFSLLFQHNKKGSKFPSEKNKQFLSDPKSNELSIRNSIGARLHLSYALKSTKRQIETIIPIHWPRRRKGIKGFLVARVVTSLHLQWTLFSPLVGREKSGEGGTRGWRARDKRGKNYNTNFVAIIKEKSRAVSSIARLYSTKRSVSLV